MNLFDTNDMIEGISNVFIREFTDNYKSFKVGGKPILLKYVNGFFRRWLYNSIVDDLELSPAALIAEDNNTYGQMPVITNRRLNAIGGLSYKIISYSWDNPPILKDIRYLYDLAKTGIKYSDEENMFDMEFYEQIYRNLNIEEPQYLNYIIILSLRLGILKKMPSIGVNMLCQGNNVLNEFDNRALFKAIVCAAIEIAADGINNFLDEDNEITASAVFDMLTSVNSVDYIFENYFTPYFEDDDEFEMETYIRLAIYEIGIAFDKWFISPFGMYLGLIAPSYTSEYDIGHEMSMFLTTASEGRFKNNDARYSLLLNSPCSFYYLTELGKEVFSVDTPIKKLYIFEKITPYAILHFMTDNDVNNMEYVIRYNYYPPFDVYSIRFRMENNKNVWLDIDVSENYTINDLTRYVLYFVMDGRVDINEYRYYGLDENSFLQYKWTSGQIDGSVYNTKVKELFKNGEELRFEASVEDYDIHFDFNFEVILKKVRENDINTDVPSTINTSKKFDELF